MSSKVSNLSSKNILLGILFIVILCLAFFGGNKFNTSYFKKELKKKDSLIGLSLKNQDSLSNLVLDLENRDTQDQEIQYNYYGEFKREQNKRKEYEKILNDIHTRKYDREFLDSLKSSVRFN